MKISTSDLTYNNISYLFNINRNIEVMINTELRLNGSLNIKSFIECNSLNKNEYSSLKEIIAKKIKNKQIICDKAIIKTINKRE